MTQEFKGPGGASTGTDAYMIDRTATPNMFTELDTTHAAALVEFSGSQAGACMDAAGFVLSLPDHPEAHVIYINLQAAADRTLTSSAFGLALITQINPGVPTRIVGTKGACVLDFQIGLWTGKVPLEAGAITYVLGGAQ